MTNRESPSVQGRIRRILSRVRLFRREKEKYAERIKEENKRIQIHRKQLRSVELHSISY